MSLRPTCSIQKVLGKPSLHSETLSQNVYRAEINELKTNRETNITQRINKTRSCFSGKMSKNGKLFVNFTKRKDSEDQNQ